MEDKIYIKMLADIEPPERHGNWIDLRAACDVDMPTKGFYMIPLGIAMKLPDKWEGIVAPRSSTFKNYGIIMTNSIGVIDTAYCGDGDEWKMPVYKLTDEPTCIHKGDRVCQFRLLFEMPNMPFVQVETLGYKDRGGFGSTGR